MYSDNNIKTTLIGATLIPDEAYVDAAFLENIPARLLVTSISDVLAHCTESTLSILSSDFSDLVAGNGIKTVRDYLENPSETNKSVLMNAATCGGLAINYASVCEGHLVGHMLGSYLHMPHGKSVGILLPAVLDYNFKIGNKKTENISKIFGCKAIEAGQKVFDLLKNAGLYDNINITDFINLRDKLHEEIWFEGNEYICYKKFGYSEREEFYSTFIDYLGHI